MFSDLFKNYFKLHENNLHTKGGQIFREQREKLKKNSL